MFLSIWAVAPTRGLASTTTTNNLALTAGSLSISGMSASSTFPSVAVGAGTVSGSMDSATWSDTTGTAAGWNGTVTTTTFIDNGAWVAGGGGVALTSNASGAYSGSAGQATMVVTVTSAVVGVSTNVNYSDTEGAGATPSTGSKACTPGSACALANGMTINFSVSGVYTAGMTYTAKSGVLLSPSMGSPTTVLQLDTSVATGPTANSGTVGGTNLPSLVNNNTTVTAGGSPVKFVSAAVLTGIGSFTIAPGFTISWDANNTWAATYSATATYTIASGP